MCSSRFLQICQNRLPLVREVQGGHRRGTRLVLACRVRQLVFVTFRIFNNHLVQTHAGARGQLCVFCKCHIDFI